MYNMPDFRKTLNQYVEKSDILDYSPGLMTRANARKDDVPREDPQEAILRRVQKYRETAEVPFEEESTTGAMTEAMRPISRAEGLGVSDLDNSGDWVATTASLLRDLEGFKEEPYYDVNAFRAGYGSDTYTTADGEVLPVTRNSRVSREDAERDLERRIRTEFGQRAKDVAGAAWDGYNAMQKAALTSVAYNYGSIPGRISGAVKSGDPKKVAQAIQSLRDDNDGINSRRRLKEAEMMLYGDRG